MEYRRRCIPHCNEKRDFQSNNPEKTRKDFYKTYDPLVGISTASILALIMLYFLVKWLFIWLERQLQLMRYKRKQHQQEQHQRAIDENSPAIPAAATTVNRHLNI
uniref:Uncharacterized protein n=1 Tax=Syphacia muris TaxID=451379 RepID=A0A0N5AHG0_9BILA